MQSLKSMTLALMGLGIGLTASASQPTQVDRQIDATVNNTKIIYLDGKPSSAAEFDATEDSVRRVISNFYYDQFRHFQDPEAPYFLFMSKDAGLAMGIGGCVRMRGYYDWGGAVQAAGFAPYLIPMTPDPTYMRHFDTTPAGTCLFFRVIGRNKTLGDYQLYIEANFNGYQGRDFHLKKAYAIVNDFTIGYASSTFADPAAQPPTVDAQGPNNKISPTAVLVRYMPVVKDKWVFAASAETPATAAVASSVDAKTLVNWMPDWAAFAQYQWQKGQHVRLSGIVRTLSYRDLHTQQNYNPMGWGLQLSSVARPWAPVTTYASFNYGKGYAGLGGDLQIGNYDLVANPSEPGRLYAPKSYGWCLGVQYNFKPNLFMSVQASQTRYLPSHGANPDDYKYGIFGAVNVFWNLTPRIQTGAEFDLGLRHNFSGEQRWARRVGAMVQFSF